ncbi:MAG: winged helix-turn-helix transcriptional regulator [Sphaerochaeta sp.]|nr:MAG: winged helix-turn-helix transcriptional regulator [Sphaerochaeta sp.]
MASVPQRGTDHGTDGGDIRLQEDVSDTEKRVILELIKNPENTYNQLASEMGVSRRSVSRAVVSLVEKNVLKESAITSSDSGKLFVDQFGVTDWSAGKGFSLYIKQLFTIFRPIRQELMPERERRCPKR